MPTLHFLLLKLTLWDEFRKMEGGTGRREVRARSFPTPIMNGLAASSLLFTLLLFQRVGRRLHSSPDMVQPIISYPLWSGTYRNLEKEESQLLCGHTQSLQLCPTLCNPMDLESAQLLCPWDFPGQNTGVPSSRDPGIEPKSPASSALQADSLPLSNKGTPRSVLKGTLMMLGNLES